MRSEELPRLSAMTSAMCFEVGSVCHAHARRSRMAERTSRTEHASVYGDTARRFLDRNPRWHDLGPGRLAPDPEHHLRMPPPDALLFDFSDSEWHFGFDGAVRMANAYPDTRCCSITGALSTPRTSRPSMATRRRCTA